MITATDRRGLPRKSIVGGLVGTLLLLGLVSTAWSCHVLHQTPGMAGPDRITACGRSFMGPGDTTTLTAVRAAGLKRVETVRTWQGRREVWGRHQLLGGDPGCGTGVYLRTGSDTFRGYALLGGP